MAIRKHFKDRDLLEYARCPLRQPHVVGYGRQPDEILAEEAVRISVLLRGRVSARDRDRRTSDDERQGSCCDERPLHANSVARAGSADTKTSG